MNAWRRFTGWVKGLSEPSAPDPSRRKFLLGMGAATAAALIAPSLPPLTETVPEFDLQAAFDLNARWSIVAEIERNAIEEIMAAEDARVFAMLEQAVNSWEAIV